MKETTKKTDVKGNKIAFIALIVLLVLLVWICVGYYKKATLNIENPVATIEVKDYGTIKIELYPDKAPETVANFIALANNGYYDGIKIDEIYKDSIVQVAATNSAGESAKLSNLYTNEDGTIDIDAYCKVTGEKESDCKDAIEKRNKAITGDTSEEENNSDSAENTENVENAESTENKEDTENSENDNESDDYTLVDKDYCIKGEIIASGFEQNDLNLTEGTIAMLRSDYTQYSSELLDESYNSATSQFFILTSNDKTGLSGYYAGFGRVTDEESMNILKEIAASELTTEEDAEEDAEATVPVKDIVITSIRVDIHGINYGMPTIYEPFDLLTWYYGNYGG